MTLIYHLRKDCRQETSAFKLRTIGTEARTNQSISRVTVICRMQASRYPSLWQKLQSLVVNYPQGAMAKAVRRKESKIKERVSKSNVKGVNSVWLKVYVKARLKGNETLPWNRNMRSCRKIVKSKVSLGPTQPRRLRPPKPLSEHLAEAVRQLKNNTRSLVNTTILWVLQVVRKVLPCRVNSPNSRRTQAWNKKSPLWMGLDEPTPRWPQEIISTHATVVTWPTSTRSLSTKASLIRLKVTLTKQV